MKVEDRGPRPWRWSRRGRGRCSGNDEGERRFKLDYRVCEHRRGGLAVEQSRSSCKFASMYLDII